MSENIKTEAGSEYRFPAFDDLPKVEGEPQGCMWGFFDKNGKKDEIGSLHSRNTIQKTGFFAANLSSTAINLLTPTTVVAASREIASGESIQLDWPLHNLQFPFFLRKPFEQNKINILPLMNLKAMDDELYINTQTGSQWDSLKHFAHQASGKYYNGLTHDEAIKSDTNGIHNWCERGGIVGRGVLVDWLSWYEEHRGDAPSPVSKYEITVDDLDQTLKWQGTTTRPGDILIIRSGYVRWHNNASTEARKSGTQDNNMAIGVQSSEKTVRWLYDHHFAAVAGDTVAFEAWPGKLDEGWCLHEWLLVQWGTPIGELWDLEKLSQKCKEERRYTFFLTSAPLHVKGGIGSPPGAIAIF